LGIVTAIKVLNIYPIEQADNLKNVLQKIAILKQRVRLFAKRV